MDDVAESLKDVDRSDHVVLAEAFQGVNTHGHELLSLLVCPRGEVLQHLQKKLLSVVDAFCPLHYQPAWEEGREADSDMTVLYYQPV